MQHLGTAIRGMEIYAGQRRFGSWRLLGLVRNLRSALTDATGAEMDDGAELRRLITAVEQQVQASMEMAPQPDTEALAEILYHLREAAAELAQDRRPHE